MMCPSCKDYIECLNTVTNSQTSLLLLHVLRVFAAFAVSAAATLAAASSGIGDRDSISPQSLYFCSTIMRDCTAGWTLPDALLQLQAAFPRVATSSCLPYRPDPTGQLGPGQLCTLDKKCFNRDWVYGNKGDTLSFKQITSIPAAQLHIRQHGGVISRFDVYTDFRSFFSNSSNAKQIYAPSAGTQLVFEHAVVLVGYDNEKQFWLAQNSWGLHWGDQGHFRVSVGIHRRAMLVCARRVNAKGCQSMLRAH